MAEEVGHASDETKAVSTLSNALPVQLGEVVGGYRLDRVLGEGSAGCVYLGTHMLLGRRAAVKILYPHLSHQPDLVRRFFHEARVVNDIRHANIVDIVDFVQTETPHVIAYVMEYINGPSLADVLKQRRLSRIQTANVCRQLCSALAAAHELGVVHRDLKPENIILLESPDSDLSVIPSVKILDFGIAKIENDRRNEDDSMSSNPTEAGVMMGTPRYMAPEQIGNDNVSPKTDVYALAELLYEMLTGQPVFAGSNMAVFQAKLSNNPLALNLPVDAIHVEYLTRVIRAGLAREPDHRIDLDEFSDAVSNWIQTPPDADMSQVSVGGLVQDSMPDQTSTIPAVVTFEAEDTAGFRNGMNEFSDNQTTFTALAYKADRPSVFLLALGIAASVLIGIAYFTSNTTPQEEPDHNAQNHMIESSKSLADESKPSENTANGQTIVVDDIILEPTTPSAVDEKPRMPQTIKQVSPSAAETPTSVQPKKPSAKSPVTRTKRKSPRNIPRGDSVPPKTPSKTSQPQSDESESPMNREEIPQW